MKYGIIISTIIFVLQIVLMDMNLHYSNPFIDRFIYYSPGFIFCLIAVFTILYFRIRVESKLLKRITNVLLFIVTPISLMFFSYSCVNIVEANIDIEKRLILGQADGWTYFAHSLRRSGLDDLRVDVQKEKYQSFGFFIRQYVDQNGLKPIGVSVDSVNAQYYRFYFKK